MKKVLSIVLSLAMVLCLMPTMAFAATTASAANAAYSDTEGKACEGAVNVLSALGVVEGYTDGQYKPENVVTRAEMAALIIRALGVSEYATATTSRYSDMANATWAIPVVEYASNLKIIEGYGDGRFGPGDSVTYEQAATMINRALGYTEELNEMNGEWPAIHVQKARALGILDDIEGNVLGTGANRGDIAIMLYNALELPQVYADNDGATHYKSGPASLTFQGQKVNGLNMMTILNKNGVSSYGIVSSQDADTAITNIRTYVGAAAKITRDKNGDVLAIGDVKTTFLTGKIDADGKNITVGDTEYSLSGVDFVDINETSGAARTTSDGAISLKNGETTLGTYIKNVGGISDKTVTIAAKVSGKTVKEIYSVHEWAVSNDAKVEESDLTQITANSKLLGKNFIKNDDREIDTTSFILDGVSSLSDIKADDIVYVYANSDDEITKIEVSDKTVTGVVTKISTTTDPVTKTVIKKYTIDGTVYETVDSAKYSQSDLEDLIIAGDEITIGLDYKGKIYTSEITDAAAGNYAVAVSRSGDPGDTNPNDSAVGSDSKVQLLTADGVKVFNVNGTKFKKNSAPDAWAKVAKQGTIVRYSVNSDSQITKIVIVNDDSDYRLIPEVSDKVTKAGYVNGVSIADNATIFTAPTTTSPAAFDYSDTDDLGTTTKDTILDCDDTLMSYVIDRDNNKIVAMIIADSSTSKDEHGVATSVYDIEDGEKGVDFYIGTEEIKDGVIDGTEPDVASKTDTVTQLYRIKKTTGGDYKFEEITPVASAPATSGSAIDVKIRNGYVQLNSSGDKYALASDLVVYIYDQSDEAYSIGTRSDLLDDGVLEVSIYKNTDTKADNYGLIDYAVIYRK